MTIYFVCRYESMDVQYICVFFFAEYIYCKCPKISYIVANKIAFLKEQSDQSLHYLPFHSTKYFQE